MSEKAKFLKKFKKDIEKYDSDKDLTKEEQDKLEHTPVGEKAALRKDMWSKKSSWDRLKRSMKSTIKRDSRK